MIAPYKNKYLKMDARFVGDDGTIMAHISKTCEGCGKEFSDQPFPTLFLSEDRTLNKKMNRPARVCVICYYRPYYESGHTIPSPLTGLF